MEDVPVCKKCSQDSANTSRLAQHSTDRFATTQRHVETSLTQPRPSEWEGRISLEAPLDRREDYHFQGYYEQQNEYRTRNEQATAWQPRWMCLLPSNVNPDVKPPKHSALHRRVTYPYFEHTRYSVSDSTPPEMQKTQNKATNPSTAKRSIESSAIVRSSNVDSPVNLTVVLPDADHMNSGAVSATAERGTGPKFSEHQPSENRRPSRKLQKRLDSRNRARTLSLRSTANTTNATPASTLPSSSIRRTSTMTQDTTCYDRPHTAIPSQDIAPARPPFFKELSSFISGRLNAGK